MKPTLVAILLIAVLSLQSKASAANPDKPVGGIFVAVGYGGFRGWSIDRQHWTAQRWSDKNADDPNIIFSLTYRDGIFLAAGGGVGHGFILRSVDGKNWTEVVTEKWRIAGVLTLRDRFISIFSDHYQTSIDGQTWQPQAEAKAMTPDGVGSGYLRRWVAGNGVVLFAGDYALPDGSPRVGWIGSSHDGNTVMKVAKFPADIRGLDFGNNVFLAVTATGDVLKSTTGFDFKKVFASADQHDDNAIRFADNQFYLIGRDHTRASPDGDHWTVLDHPPHLPRAQSPTGTAIDCGWGGIEFTNDGKSWSKAQIPTDATGICAVAWGIPQKS